MAKAGAKRGGGAMDFLAAVEEDGRKTFFVPLDNIDADPDQPRAEFRPLDGIISEYTQQALRELADDIWEHQLQEPIKLRVHPIHGHGHWMIVFGERRWRAHLMNRELGRNVTHIEAFEHRDDNGLKRMLIQASENIQREDLSDMEIASFMRRLLDEYPDEIQHQDLAALFKKPKSWVSRMLGLLDPRYAGLVKEGFITFASILEHYKALPSDSQLRLAENARSSGKTINSLDIKREREQAKAKKSEPSSSGSKAASHTAVVAVPGAAIVRQELRLRLPQLFQLAEVLTNPSDVQVSAVLDVEEIEAAIKKLGRKPVNSKIQLAQQLIDILVQEAKADKKRQ